MDVQVFKDFAQYWEGKKAGQKPMIEVWEPITDGWETEVYAFQVSYEGTEGRVKENLILRMYPSEFGEKARREWIGVNRLYEQGYPVPKAQDFSTDLAVLGKPFLIMERVFGRPLGELMRTDPANPRHFSQFVGLLVQLHRLDPAPFHELLPPGVTYATPADFLQQKLGEGRYAVEHLGQTWLRPALDWLVAHQPSPTSDAHLAVLHGDFHPFNILVTLTGEAYVIDWPNVETGDYRYDLAWTILLSTTFGQPTERRQLILDEYGRQVGQPVQAIEYFEAIAAIRRLIDFMRALEQGGESLGMRPEAAAIMQENLPHFRAVYAVWQGVTGVALPEIEAALAM